MPVLVFIAEFDQSFDVELTRQFAAQLDDARVEVIANENHDVISRPNRVSPVLEPFLLQQIAR
jgi:ABC-type branched-subunit amino acid transport system substrate-binding protein